MPSSDHCCTKTVPPSSDHHGTMRLAPSSDHLHTKITKKQTVGKQLATEKGGPGADADFGEGGGCENNGTKTFAAASRKCQ